jgi:hypothetical protein
VATARPHRQLLGAAGFTQVTETECTAEFAAAARAWIRQWEANHEDLVAVLGEPAVEQRQAERRAQLRAIEDGILSRSLFTACRPEEHHRRRKLVRSSRLGLSWADANGSGSHPQAKGLCGSD